MLFHFLQINVFPCFIGKNNHSTIFGVYGVNWYLRKAVRSYKRGKENKDVFHQIVFLVFRGDTNLTKKDGLFVKKS